MFHSLKIYPNEQLLKPTKLTKMGTLEDRIRADKIANRMAQLMYEEGGVGLAANQIGYDESIIVINKDGKPSKSQIILYNPFVISETENKMVSTEGCLSVPNRLFKVVRSEGITIGFTDSEELLDLYGIEAIIFQHEYDHLNGITLANNPKAKEINSKF